MKMKTKTILLAAVLCAVGGCSSAKDTAPANNTNANRAISVTTANANAAQTVVVSDANNSIQVTQSDSNTKNNVQITGANGEKLKVKNSSEVESDAEETSEVSDGSGSRVKSTTKNGEKTTVITDSEGNIVETRTDSKTKQTVLSDRKDNNITIGPNGVTLKDKKGNKIVVPQ